MTILQGLLPIYETRTKRILGVYVLPYAKTFVGNETSHNVNFPAASTSANTVPVQKIEPVQMDINNDRRQQDWFMAAVFTHEQIRLGVHTSYPNYRSINEYNNLKRWSAPSSHPNRFVETIGAVLKGLAFSFDTGAPNETSYLTNYNWAVAADDPWRNKVAPSSAGGISVASFDPAVAMLNDDGTLRWQRTFTSVLGSFGNLVWQTATQGADVLCAQEMADATFGFGAIAKMNGTTGAVIWNKFFNAEPTQGEAVTRVAASADIIYIAVQRGMPGSLYKTGVVKLNSSGVVAWQKLLKDASTKTAAEDLIMNTSNETALVCSVNSADRYLVKLDSSGNIVWCRALNTEQRNYIKFLSSGDIILSAVLLGTTTPVLARISGTTGDPVWVHRFTESSPRGVALDSSNNVYVYQGSYEAAGTSVVHKFDENGTLIWERQLQSANFFTDEDAIAIRQDNIYLSAKTAATKTLIINVPTDGTLTGSKTVNAETFTWAADNGGLSYANGIGDFTCTTSAVITQEAGDYVITDGDLVAVAYPSVTWVAPVALP
jgi:hypothetical protein